MSTILDEVKLFKPGIPARQFNEMLRIFPESHFARLKGEGFRFYHNTFWFPLDRKPENVFEEIVIGLKKWAAPTPDVIGAEWWFSVGNTNSTPQWILPYHFDRNDLAERDVTKLKYPYRSSVLFMHSVPYGELVVTDQVQTPKGVSPIQPRDMRFIKPARNIYVTFPGQLLHGVVGRMWRPEKPNKLRMTMAVNWWTERPKAAYVQDSRNCMSAFRLDGRGGVLEPEPAKELSKAS